MQNAKLALNFQLSTLNSDCGRGASIIGGAPTVLDRRRAAPLIGGAVCNCLIGCAESLFFRHCEAWYKPWQSPTFGCGDSEACQGARIIGGAPAVLDRRRATPLIGDAVCNRLIGCAESFSTPNS